MIVANRGRWCNEIQAGLCNFPAWKYMYGRMTLEGACNNLCAFGT